MPRRPDPTARERILDVAARLFAEHGVHAVGLQQIIDEGGCGKNLLYREFGSKDDLVVAYLQGCRTDWDATVERAESAAPEDPGRQLVEIVSEVAEQSVAEGFRGCPLRNAFAEFPDPGHPAHQVIVGYYADRQVQLRGLAADAGAADPDTLADRIALIIDGLNANGPVLGRDGAFASSLDFAEELVAGATQRRRRRTTAANGRRRGR
jgi:AcrR family transcriptional regulator